MKTALLLGSLLLSTVAAAQAQVQTVKSMCDFITVTHPEVSTCTRVRLGGQLVNQKHVRVLIVHNEKSRWKLACDQNVPTCIVPSPDVIYLLIGAIKDKGLGYVDSDCFVLLDVNKDGNRIGIVEGEFWLVDQY